MDTQTIIELKNDVSRRYDPWHAHNIQLKDDIYTIAPRIVGDEIKLRRLVQCVLDLAGGSAERLRVLDLACCEGLYGIEFARQGATVVGIEGRLSNLERSRFAKRVLGLDKLELVQDDVRNLSADRYGTFDVVLCLGILYHLDAPDVFSFIAKLSEVCTRLCIIDTRVTLHPKSRYTYAGETYYATKGEEHDPVDWKKTAVARAGLPPEDNTCLWLSRPSIYNLLSRAGFTSAYECNLPAEPKKPADRLTFAAIKGQPCLLRNAPLMASQPQGRMPERPVREHGISFGVARSVYHLMPRRSRELSKRLLRLEKRT